ncbi:MAG: methyl-accepting chemotaxis protein, partial [Treponema sp.]|nr:methyl-accepting chemotaxis protein [Treponema sp.]
MIIAGTRVSGLSLCFIGITVLFAFAFVLVSVLDVFRSVGNLKKLFAGLEDNDLSMDLTVKSEDEFGELMQTFNRFLSQLRTAFASFNHDASMVAVSVYDLSASAKEITTTANQQSASVSEIVSTMENSK